MIRAMSRHAPLPRIRQILRMTLRPARDLWSLHRQRSALLDLDDHLLRDIGLTRMAASREANRPIWDLPTHWRR